MLWLNEIITVPRWCPWVNGAIQAVLFIEVVYLMAERRFWERFGRVLENRLIDARECAGRADRERRTLTGEKRSAKSGASNRTRRATHSGGVQNASRTCHENPPHVIDLWIHPTDPI